MQLNKKTDPKGIKSIFDQIIRRNGLDIRMEEAEIPGLWVKTVGDMISSHSQVENYKDGILYISTESSSWRSEILLRRNEIVENLNSHLKKLHIKELNVR